MTRPMILVAVLVSILVVGCDLSPIAPTPTSAIVDTDTPPPTLTTAPATDTATAEPQVATMTPSDTSIPTETFTPSPTYNPYATYVIQENDTLFYVIQKAPFYYHDASVIDEILRLNPNVPNPNQLPPPGSSIIIPLPSFTPTPEGFELTVAAQPGGSNVISGISQVTQVEVKEGITILGIAGQYNTNLPILATLNPQLFFYNCDFSNPSGGPDCNVPMRVGDKVNVPAPTPTPTLSPTFSGLETATPTPTYAPPAAVFPPSESTAPGRVFPLQWISAGMLLDNEVYLVEIQDETTGARVVDVTRGTSYMLPDSAVPSDGQTHTIHWRVTVAKPNDAGAYAFISPQSDFHTFYWQSR